MFSPKCCSINAAVTILNPNVNLATGKPACPVACKYCVITQVESRSKEWKKRTSDKTTNEILEPSLLEGDFISFNAISDPLWNKFQKEFQYFTEIANIGRISSLVTKMPLTNWHIKLLRDLPNFRLVVSITGLDQIEKTSTKIRLKNLEIAKKEGILAFPLIHPYIEGLTNLSFLPELKNLGYNELDIKGFRWDSSMDSWYNNSTYTSNEEFLPNKNWKEIFEGFEIKSLKTWYKETCTKPGIELVKATKLVDTLLDKVFITSSSSNKVVRKAAIERRVSLFG